MEGEVKSAAGTKILIMNITSKFGTVANEKIAANSNFFNWNSKIFNERIDIFDEKIEIFDEKIEIFNEN